MLSSGHGRDAAADTNAATASLLQDVESNFCVAERITQALLATGYPPLRNIEVSAFSQVFVLQGRVPNYYMKQIAQAVALNAAGDREVRNEVTVGS
jgi:osmotically-inducible protein OsmY